MLTFILRYVVILCGPVELKLYRCFPVSDDRLLTDVGRTAILRESAHPSRKAILKKNKNISAARVARAKEICENKNFGPIFVYRSFRKETTLSEMVFHNKSGRSTNPMEVRVS